LHCTTQHLSNEGAQQQFQVVITDYVLHLFKHYHSHAGGSSQSQSLVTTGNAADKKTTHKQLISQYLSQRLMRIIHDIQRSVVQQDSNADEDDAAATTSSSLALHFIVYVCHVLKVDVLAASEVTKLRKVWWVVVWRCRMLGSDAQPLCSESASPDWRWRVC
jgi:hypothetical protein